MGYEIERKFLVRRDLWPGSSVITSTTPFRQGYLSAERGRTVRVRLAGQSAYLTIKGESVGLVRPEFEYEIPVTDAAPLLAMCPGPLIEKLRHVVMHEGHAWEVDEFEGVNVGLFVAEIELVRADEPFACPDWIGLEVTADRRYLNSNLVEHPYTQWLPRVGD